MALSITYFVHGTTTDNEAGLATGWLPGTLSEKGKEQAHALHDALRDEVFDLVVSSDLDRAVETAEIVFGDRYPLYKDARLRECDYGEWNGTDASAFKDNMADYITSRYPNGEHYGDVEARMRALVDNLRQVYDGKRIAFVAHQAPQLALEVIANGKTWEEAIAEDWRKTGNWQPGWSYELGA